MLKTKVQGVILFGVPGEITIEESRVIFLTEHYDVSKDYEFTQVLSVRKSFQGEWQFTTADPTAETKDVSAIVRVTQLPKIGDARLGVSFKDPVADALFQS